MIVQHVSPAAISLVGETLDSCIEVSNLTVLCTTFGTPVRHLQSSSFMALCRKSQRQRGGVGEGWGGGGEACKDVDFFLLCFLFLFLLALAGGVLSLL